VAIASVDCGAGFRPALPLNLLRQAGNLAHGISTNQNRSKLFR
jgi:hypothetical protein